MTSFGATTPVTSRALNTAFLQLEAQIASASGSPVGSIVMWSGTTVNIPTGYALCNGASLPTSTYVDLFTVIQYRYGGSGANFNLPDFTSRVPEGTIGVPTIPATETTSASSAVDVHTHTVNSSLSAGNAASHVHADSFLAGNTNCNFSAGSVNNHTHGMSFNSGNSDPIHQHSYFKPNSGSNQLTGNTSINHAHLISGNTSGVNAGYTPNSSFANGSVNSSFTAGGVNTAIGVNTSLTAGDASTINSSTLTHTHAVNITQVIFIIKVV